MFPRSVNCFALPCVLITNNTNWKTHFVSGGATGKFRFIYTNLFPIRESLLRRIVLCVLCSIEKSQNLNETKTSGNFESSQYLIEN